MNIDFFKGVKQWEYTLPGLRAKLPVFYYDATSLTSIYTASTGKIKALLPLSQMTPIELFPGRCLVAFMAFEYRKSDIDPYNEFCIAFLIKFHQPQIPFFTAAAQMYRRRFTAYIWQLPVTTEIARIGGVDGYGYPKFLADIEFQRQTDRLTCHLSENSRKILSLSGKILPTSKGKITRVRTYSVLDSIPLTANICVNPIEMAQTNDKQAATLEIGEEHKISRQLRELGLSSEPIQYQYTPVFQAILFAGRNLMDNS